MQNTGGNVGIGTGTDQPENKLDVRGGLIIGLKNSTNSAEKIQFRMGDGNVGTTIGYPDPSEGGNFVFRNSSEGSSFSFLINVGGNGVQEVARFGNEGSFQIIGTGNNTGIISVINPGSSPIGSTMQFSSPSGHPGVIFREGNGSGGALRRWDMYLNDGKFCITDNSAGAERITIKTNGYVGIGYANPSHRLQVDGQIASGGTVLTSDQRLKRDIQDYSTGLALVEQMKVKKYKYKKPEKKENEAAQPDLAGENSFYDQEQIGVLAQDIQKIAPNLIGSFTDDEGEETLTVNFTAFTFILINAVKEQQLEIETLENRITALEQLLQKKD